VGGVQARIFSIRRNTLTASVWWLLSIRLVSYLQGPVIEKSTRSGITIFPHKWAMTNTNSNTQPDLVRKKQDSRAGWMVLILTLTIQALATMVLLVPPVMAPVLSEQLGVPAGY